MNRVWLAVVAAAVVVVSGGVAHAQNKSGPVRGYDDDLCQRQLLQFEHGLTNGEMWAIKMLDASSKIPSGIFYGHMVDIGGFDECLAISEGDIRGQHCMVNLPFPALPQKPATTVQPARQGPTNVLGQERMILNPPGQPQITLSLCLPASCSPLNMQADIEGLLALVNGYLHTDLRVTSITMCQTADTEDVMDSAAWGVTSFLIIVLILMALSTSYDCYCQYYKREHAHLLLIAFSVRHNGKKIFSSSNNPNQLTCLNGIRFISMMWVVYGHTATMEIMRPVLNIVDFQLWQDKLYNMHLLGATVSVDSFFVLSGLLICHGFLNAKAKGVKFNILMFYVHRYLRLTPVFAVVVWIHATIITQMGSGPFWPLIDATLKQPCKDNWWISLLYLQNYLRTDHICIGQTWYLGTDTQLYVLSPLLLIPLWLWPGVTLAISGLLVALSCVIPFVVTWCMDVGTLIVSQDPNYMRDYYYTTHTRFGPYLIGILLGYILFRTKRKGSSFRMTPAVAVAGWIAALTVMAAVVFGPHNLLQHAPERLENALFNAFHRNAWAVALSFVIFACVHGYGSVVNWFLSLSIFEILGRFTYTMYLTHMSLQVLHIGSSRYASYFSDGQTIFIFWSYITITLFISIALTLAFESPMVIVEKVIFQSGAKRTAAPPEVPVESVVSQ